MTEQRYLGFVEVDSGTLVIGDPAYLLADAASGRPGVDYARVLEAHEQVSRLDGRPVLLIQQFGGDGTFPVFGEYEDGELVRVTIDLVELQA